MIKFLIICCIIYIIFRYVIPFVFPVLLGSYLNKKMSEMGGQQRSYKNRRREGEVTIDYTPDKKSKKYPNNSGEYVDYEEIK